MFFTYYLIYFFDLSSLSQQLAAEHAQEQDLKHQFTIGLDKQVEVEKDVLKLKNLKNTLSLWQQKFILKSEVPSLLDEIVKFAESNHLQVNNLTPDIEIKEKEYIKIPVKIRLLGTFNQIANFMSAITNNHKIILINNFNIVNDSDTAQSGGLDSENILTAEINLDIYTR
jgi:type IV pilus assembly protein PilO